RSYAVGISNGGYQVRRALETDAGPNRLYDGGVDWEGTLFTNAENLFSYLPTSLAAWPGDVLGTPSAVQALAAVGFNPQSEPLWSYHWSVYWGLTQKIYRLEFDPEYTGYTCSSTSGVGTPCVSPPAEQVLPSDPDATYDYQARLAALPALAGRMDSVANTGAIADRLITVQGDQDALLPIRTDGDLYAQMVGARGRAGMYRFYTVAGGNHVDPQFDDHYGVDAYGDNVLRPILPCARAALDALSAWVERGQAPPPSGTIPRPAGASATELANVCSLGG
ncbi:MAG TPA: alpha/beta hydrolase domain-containing protein, partial [Solirubrobacteraceae bacterium]|nr:alpha/beta hydrolase domain-containing protein [Solirubrobacteraceae bacterium]